MLPIRFFQVLSSTRSDIHPFNGLSDRGQLYKVQGDHVNIDCGNFRLPDSSTVLIYRRRFFFNE